jgi:AraC-like DNA-binding protein
MQVRILRHPCLGGVELKQIRGLSSATTQLNETIKLAMSDDGPFRYRSRGANSLIPPRGIAVGEPGEVHTAAPFQGDVNADVLFIDDRALSRFVQDELRVLRAGFSLKDPVCTTQGLYRAFLALTAVLGDSAAPGLLAEERVYGLLGTLGSVVCANIENLTDRFSYGARVRRAREMIHDLFSEPLTLDALAEASGLQKWRFLRAFKSVVGLPPHAYQTHLRVHHARQLIAWGASIAEASTSVGFCDQSHFHRHFVRIHGLTPGQYRSDGGWAAMSVRAASSASTLR